MAQFNYLLAFNPNSPEVSTQRLQIFISQNRDIESWYFPFSGAFILKSNLTLVDLNHQFMLFFGLNSYVLTYMVPSFVGGSLPPLVWEWVSKLDNPALEAK